MCKPRSPTESADARSRFGTTDSGSEPIISAQKHRNLSNIAQHRIPPTRASKGAIRLLGASRGAADRPPRMCSNGVRCQPDVNTRPRSVRSLWWRRREKSPLRADSHRLSFRAEQELLKAGEEPRGASLSGAARRERTSPSGICASNEHNAGRYVG